MNKVSKLHKSQIQSFWFLNSLGPRLSQVLGIIFIFYRAHRAWVWERERKSGRQWGNPMKLCYISAKVEFYRALQPNWEFPYALVLFIFYVFSSGWGQTPRANTSNACVRFLCVLLWMHQEQIERFKIWRDWQVLCHFECESSSIRCWCSIQVEHFVPPKILYIFMPREMRWMGLRERRNECIRNSHTCTVQCAQRLFAK